MFACRGLGKQLPRGMLWLMIRWPWQVELTLGQRGERVAAKHLRQQGYRILARNLRSRIGEVDLVASDCKRDAIAIVEVKTTQSDDPPPEVHVDPRKQRKLTALAMDLVRRHRWEDRAIRFDVVAIVWPAGAKRPSRITHHVGAFEARW